MDKIGAKFNGYYILKNRMSINYGDKMGNMDCCWTEELASSEGMHFHVWIPKSNLESEQKFLSQFRYQTNFNRDAVSFSWSYL